MNEWQKPRSVTLWSDMHLGPALHWLPDGRLIYVLGSAQQQQDSSMWVVPLLPSGKISFPTKRIVGGHGWISQVTGSGDGKALIFLGGNWLPSVYIGTLSADGTSLLANKRLTLDENENIPSSWTPDSKAVLFTSDRNGIREIFKHGRRSAYCGKSDDQQRAPIATQGSARWVRDPIHFHTYFRHT